MRHKWKRISKTLAVDECVRCHTTRKTIAFVGIKYQRELRTYLRSDGIRFTGRAPQCEPLFTNGMRPALNVVKQRNDC